MIKLALVVFLAVITNGASLSRYIPTSWNSMCVNDVSVISSPASNRPAVLINLQCTITNSNKQPWKLNDLRSWTIDQDLNKYTTPANRTFLYNISVTCETGVNISLPWPMRVAGLIELRVKYCGLLDKFINLNDPVDPTIDEDLKFLEIRHSSWIHDLVDISLLEMLSNLTSHFDCIQDSSVEQLIMSNISTIIGEDEEVAALVSEKSAESNISNADISNGPAKPEDRLTKDMTKVVSDHSDIKSETSETTTEKPEGTLSNSSRNDPDDEYLRMLRTIEQTKFSCNFSKLVFIDDSISPVTSKDYFSAMVKNAQYPVLEKMNVSYFGLRELPEELAMWRGYFPKLKFLDLSRNAMKELVVRKFPPVKGVGTVTFDLQYNNFTTVNIEMLQDWAEVKQFFVNIRNNPIHCGCEIADLLPHLADSSTFQGSMAAYEYVKDLQCYTPAQLKGRKLGSLTTDSLQCPVYKSNDAIVVALCVVLSLLIMAIIFIIKFKIEIRILLYTRFHIRLPWDSDIQRNNKLFDAFVSHSNEDSDWVIENLLKFLENTPNRMEVSKDGRTFRLCIHQRDFVVGKSILDNIVDSIATSRHTIIVLSPSFIRSQWAMEELRQAYKQSLMDRNRHLIVILLEKVSKDDMDPLIRRCCKTFTYLEATDSLFKDRLVFALTTKSRNSGRVREDGKDSDNDSLPTKEKESKVPQWTGQVEPNIYSQIDLHPTYDNPAFYGSHPAMCPPELPGRNVPRLPPQKY